MGGADPLRRYLSLKSVTELLDEWATIATQGGNQNRAYRELSNAVVSNRLMSQIEEYKAKLNELGGEEVQIVLMRLIRAEATIGRLH